MSKFTGAYVTRILDLKIGEFWVIKFKQSEETKQIRIRELCLQSWYRSGDSQILIRTPTATYGLESTDGDIMDKIEQSLEAIT